jgi:hypothetical protein
MPPSAAIRVRVANYASQASPDFLGRAEREASRILAEAGLQIIWVNCPRVDSSSSLRDPCLGPLEATDVVLRVLPRVNRAKFQDTEFGFAVVPTLASVYSERVMRLAVSDEATFEGPISLGCVIAHELGHLLLGSGSHARTGIMQSRWDRKQIRQATTGRLLFTEEESQRMKREVAARAGLHEPHR